MVEISTSKVNSAQTNSENFLAPARGANMPKASPKPIF